MLWKRAARKGQIRTVSYSCCQMDRRTCFSFCLTREEKSCALEAIYYKDPPGEFINWKAPVAPDAMTELTGILDRHRTVELLRSPGKRKKPLAADEPVYRLSLEWEGGNTLTSQTPGSCAEELEQFFRLLADSAVPG